MTALLGAVFVFALAMRSFAFTGNVAESRQTYDAPTYAYDGGAVHGVQARPSAEAPVAVLDASIGVQGAVAGATGSLAVVLLKSVAANTGDDLVNLASPSRTNHILNGDATGGGHLWPGAAGKTPFPQGWSSGDVMGAISDVATNPSSVFTVGRTGVTIATGEVNGVVVRVVMRNGEIITGYPTNLPVNP